MSLEQALKDEAKSLRKRLRAIEKMAATIFHVPPKMGPKRTLSKATRAKMTAAREKYWNSPAGKARRANAAAKKKG